MIIPPRPGGRPPVDDFPSAPLLSPESFVGLREMANREREPKKALSHLYLDCCEAERAVHVAHVSGDSAAVRGAEWERAAARAKLREEQEHVGNSFLIGLSHSFAYQPDELADLLAQLFRDGRIRAAFVPVLQQLLQPTVDWVRGEQRDIEERVTNLETIAATEEAYS
ncbi:hypothetical protein [Limnoglobus roseus]|uniref:Uncharacterized protein n=1 Tax=Limnoglobus roseus TaxID=2598579 RepID=A0A5C1AGP2_9BACT|nr:hypothetical protein [Limnoglobus roseus]QEL17413.1 hypothetical protein PX52LOC_04402 [Limnoglobus roseus]